MAAVGSATSLGGEDKKSLSEMLQSVARWQDRQEAAKANGETLPAGGMSMPFTAKEEAVTSGSGVRYNGYSHSFAGMGIQFILFAAIDFGVAILLEKKQGLWKRFRERSHFAMHPALRDGPLGGAAIAGSDCLAATFGVGMLVFGIRVHGSIVGFVGLLAASALMASTFGLMLAALGRTPNATRGIAILAVLLLVMMGGGWVPSFIFPAWMQTATLGHPHSVGRGRLRRRHLAGHRAHGDPSGHRRPAAASPSSSASSPWRASAGKRSEDEVHRRGADALQARQNLPLSPSFAKRGDLAIFPFAYFSPCPPFGKGGKGGFPGRSTSLEG